MPQFKHKRRDQIVTASGSETEARFAEDPEYTLYVPIVEPAYPDGDAAESWKGEQLKAYAKAHDIDLGTATTKADMLKAIEASKATATPPAAPASTPPVE